jgi:hypothetical protein
MMISFMIFFIFDERRDLASDLVDDYRYGRISYQVHEIINVTESSRYEQDSASSLNTSSFVSDHSNFRNSSLPQMNDLMLSVFLEVVDSDAVPPSAE